MLDKNEVARIRAWFEGYAASYLASRSSYTEDIRSKYGHSFRVAENCIAIGTSLNFSAKQLLVAQLSGLLHDIGRFSQLKEYNTYIDLKSVDHGSLGVIAIKKHAVLHALEERIREIMYTAIVNHNKMTIDPAITGEKKLFVQLLRDADKLDIFNMLTEYYSNNAPDKGKNLILDLPDLPEISMDVCNDLLAGHIVQSKNLKTLNDFKILKLGWVYDINFPKTYQIIREKNYLQIIYDSLPHTDITRRIYNQVKTYLDKRAGEGEIG
jgi:hypothetical protein